jgi:hypothetical protein
MKQGKIILAVAGTVVALVSAFSFKAHSTKFGTGTLYTIGRVNHVACSRVLTGNPCGVNAYTIGGTKVTNAKAVAL